MSFQNIAPCSLTFVAVINPLLFKFITSSFFTLIIIYLTIYNQVAMGYYTFDCCVICNACKIAGVICLICMPKTQGLRAYISGNLQVPMLLLICNIALWLAESGLK